MDLADPELELVDPTPNVHALFVHFDKVFFWTRLASRAVVRWSKRMFSCAGTCSYQSGLCDIALSEPLLKLRPRKDLVETLLHEMIHAYLFITNRDTDRDGHGPNFQAHMHRINRAAGLNISIYHDFHEEVRLYQTHWWRCNGPCQTRKPHFGIVRRTCNRAPGPADCWYEDHKRKCGGTFIKIKEPEKANKKKSTIPKPKPNADITKYINNNIKTINNIADNNNIVKKPVLKDTSNISKGNVKTKSNSSSTLVVTKKGVVFNPTAPQPNTPARFTGKGQTINGRNRSNSVDVLTTVRNVWVNKQILNINNNTIITTSNPNKHKSPVQIKSPPAKIKKIDDYFKSTATTVLKDLYGEDFKLTQATDSKKLIAVKVDLVDCPICNNKINNDEINRHLDECLNKDVIEKMSKSDIVIDNIPKIDVDRKNILDKTPPVPAIKGENVPLLLNATDLTTIDTDTLVKDDLEKLKQINFEKKTQIKHNSIDITTLDKKVENTEKTRKSIDFVTKVRGDTLNIKTEPGTNVSDEFEPICPCCGKKFDKPIREHLDECLIFDNNTPVPEEGASTSYADTTIIIDDEDDDLDESITMNATGTKTPCPCCLTMIELAEMNDHLDVCLQS